MKSILVAGAVVLATTLTLGIAAPAQAYPDNDPIIADNTYDDGFMWLDPTTFDPMPVGTVFGTTGAWTVTEGFAIVDDGREIFLMQYDPTTYDPAAPENSPTITSAVSQTFPTTPGATYYLSYHYVGNGSFSALIDGVSVESFTEDGEWFTHEFLFTATGHSTLLTFEYTDDEVDSPQIPNGYGNVLEEPYNLGGNFGGFDHIWTMQWYCGDPTDGSAPPNCLPTPIGVAASAAAVVAVGAGVILYLWRRRSSSLAQ